MKKSEYIKSVRRFAEYVTENAEAIHSKPVKGVSCNYGAHGHLYQGLVGEFLGLTRGRLVAEKGQEDARSDFYAGGLVLEVKCNCSKLDILFSTKKVDYVCYCPDFLGPQDQVEYISYVMSKASFLSVLEQVGLIRERSGHIAIQSYKNSKRKYERFLDLLDEYNEMSLEEYRDLIRERGRRG